MFGNLITILLLLITVQKTFAQEFTTLNIAKVKQTLEYVSGYDTYSSENNYYSGNDIKNCKQEIEKIHNEYVDSWLKSDENRLMNLIDENATLQPSLMKPVIGKKNIRAFWFPNDSSKTKINAFTTKIINFSVIDDLAVTTHTSYLEYTYESGNKKSKHKQKAINTTIYKQQPDKNWKIWKSMWADYSIEIE